MQTLPVLGKLNQINDGQINFKKTGIIGAQHVLAQMPPFVQALIGNGLNPRRLFVIPKVYSLAASVAKTVTDRGVRLHKSQENYLDDEPFSIHFHEDIARHWDNLERELLADIQSGEIDTLLILDDGSAAIREGLRRLNEAGKVFRSDGEALSDEFDTGRLITYSTDATCDEYDAALAQESPAFWQVFLEKGCGIAAVEQTSAGVQNMIDYLREASIQLSFPIVLVASSALKYELESKLIAEHFLSKFQGLYGVRLARTSEQNPFKLGVVGIGHIGRSQIELLQHRYGAKLQFIVYDAQPSQVEGFLRLCSQELKPIVAKTLAELIQESHAVMGCTGRDIFKDKSDEEIEALLSSLPGDLELFSASSENIEFYTLIHWAKRRIQQEGRQLPTDPLADLACSTAGKKITIHFRGYPFNFKNFDPANEDRVSGIDPDRFQFLMGALYGALLQAQYSASSASTVLLSKDSEIVSDRFFHILHPAIQRIILKAALESGSLKKGEYSKEILAIFDSAFRVAMSSQYVMRRTLETIRATTSAYGMAPEAVARHFFTIGFPVDMIERCHKATAGIAFENYGAEDRRVVVSMWNQPIANQHFVGQARWLTDIRQQLQNTSSEGLTVLTGLHGLGGVGKTYLANEIFHADDLHYFFRGWLRADSAQLLEEEYLRFGETLNLFHPHLAESEKLEVVREWFEQKRHAGWLLVYDNAQDMESLRPYLPRCGGHILVTSRNPHWQNAIAVDVMSEEDAVILVKKTIDPENRHPFHEDENAGIRELVRRLGYLPLAIAQASAYMQQKKEPISADLFRAYLSKYETSKKHLLGSSQLPPRDRHDSIYITWNMNIEEIANKNPLAVQLLVVCAYLDSDVLTEDLLRCFHQASGADISAEQLRDALALLQNYSLLKFNADTHQYAIHRVVQEVIQEQEKSEDLQARSSTLPPFFGVRSAVDLMASQLIYDQYNAKTLKGVDAILPHVRALLSVVSKNPAFKKQVSPEVLVHLMLTIGAYYIFERNDATNGILYLKQAEEIAESIHVLELQGLVCNYLGWACHLSADEDEQEIFRYTSRAISCYQSLRQGAGVIFALHTQGHVLRCSAKKFDEAQKKLEEALALARRVPSSDVGSSSETPVVDSMTLDIDNPIMRTQYRISYEVSEVLNEFGILYQAKSQYVLAEKYYHWALAMRIELAGEGPSEAVAETHQLLGDFYRERKKLKEAESHYHEALRIRQDIVKWSPSRRKVNDTLHMLGHLYEDQEEYAKAEEHFVSSLSKDICSQEAPFSTTNATRLRELGDFYKGVGQYKDAETCYSRALQMEKERFHDQPSSTISMILHRFALLYESQGDLDKAGDYHLQSLNADIALSQGKPTNNVATSLRALGNIYRKQKKYAEAETQYRKALDIELTLSKENPTAGLYDVHHAWGHLCEDQEDYGNAEAHFLSSIDMGGEHPEVQFPEELSDRLYAMGEFYEKRERDDEAKVCYERSLKIKNDLSGGAVTEGISVILYDLACLCERQGDLRKAEDYHLRSLNAEVALSEGKPTKGEAISFRALGNLCRKQARYSEAETQYRKALDIEMALSQGNPTAGLYDVHHDWGHLCEDQEAYGNAEAHFLSSIDMGGEHPEVQFPEELSDRLYAMGEFYEKRERDDEAKVCYERSLQIKNDLFGEAATAEISVILYDLARLCERQGDICQAESYHLQSLNADIALSDGKPTKGVAISSRALGNLCRTQKRYSEAEGYYKRALEVEMALAGEHPTADFSEMLCVLIDLCEKQGKLEDVVRYRAMNESLIEGLHGGGEREAGREGVASAGATTRTIDAAVTIQHWWRLRYATRRSRGVEQTARQRQGLGR
ncbi:MAG: hypothetical protein A2103_04460 [Gammaproteobacteria bacterium GWF2_41_13]|nr:MAG: hypothetical protein A2103_04460 [Gammaproteobacteria bacterium GWF2_41_13]